MRESGVLIRDDYMWRHERKWRYHLRELYQRFANKPGGHRVKKGYYERYSPTALSPVEGERIEAEVQAREKLPEK